MAKQLKKGQILTARVKGARDGESSSSHSDSSMSSNGSSDYSDSVGTFDGKLVTVIGSTKNEFFSDDNSIDSIFATLDLIFQDSPSKVRFLVSGGFLGLNGHEKKNYLEIFEKDGFVKVFEGLSEDKLFEACDSEADRWIQERNGKIFSVFKAKYPEQFEIVPTKNFHSEDGQDDFNWACGVLGKVLDKNGGNCNVFMGCVQKDAEGFELRDMRRKLKDKLGDKGYGELKLANDIEKYRTACKEQGLISVDNTDTLLANYQLTVIIESLYHLIELRNKTGSFVYPNKEMAVYKWLRENFATIAEVANYSEPSWDQVVVTSKKFDFLVSVDCKIDQYGYGISGRKELLKKADANNKTELAEQLKKHQPTATSGSSSPRRKSSADGDVRVNLNGGIGEYSGRDEKVAAFLLACLGQLNNEQDAFYLTWANKALTVLQAYCNQHKLAVDIGRVDIGRLVMLYNQVKATNAANISDALSDALVNAGNGGGVSVDISAQKRGREAWLYSFFTLPDNGLTASNPTSENFMKEQEQLCQPD